MKTGNSALSQWARTVSALQSGLESIDATLQAFNGSPAYAGLLALSRSVNCLSRGQFLRNLQSFLEDSMRCEAEVVCSVGAGIEDSRQARLIGAGLDSCDPDEHLIINLYGASRAGNIVPLVIFTEKEIELEGVMNLARSPAAREDAARDQVLHASAQLLALAFRNLKTASRLAEICPENRRKELAEVLARFRGGDLLRRLSAFTAARKETGQKKRGFAARLAGFLLRAHRTAMLMTVLLFAAAFASYARLQPFSEPFNCAAAGMGRVTLGVPFDAAKKALDDGLLRVMVDTRDPQRIHDWLKGGNPSGVDYEEVLMADGWDNGHLHRVGRAIGMVPR